MLNEGDNDPCPTCSISHGLSTACPPAASAMLPPACRRYVAAVELLGERDEALEELRADLQDVKHLYK